MKKAIVIFLALLLVAAFGAFAAPNALRILHVAGPELDHLIANLKDFESAFNAKVSIDQTTREAMAERTMRELIEQRGDYDVVLSLAGDDYTTFVYKGNYIPIEKYLSKQEVQQYWGRKVITDPRTGLLAGIPQYHNSEMLFYRKDLLQDPKEQAAFKKKYGRDLKVPKTPKELYEVAEFFTRPPNLYGYMVGGLEWSWWCDYQYFLFGQGQNVGDKNGNLTLNTPGAVKAMDYLAKIVKFNPHGWESQSFFDADAMMKAGKIFAYQNWSYIWKDFVTTMPDKIGIAAPVGDVEPGVYLSGWLALIPAKAENPELAVKFLKWIGGFDYQKKIALDMLGNLPSRSDVLKNAEVRKAIPGVDQFERTMSYGHVARTTWKAEMSSALYDAFFRVVKGEMSAKDALDQLQNVKFAGRKAIE